MISLEPVFRDIVRCPNCNLRQFAVDGQCRRCHRGLNVAYFEIHLSPTQMHQSRPTACRMIGESVRNLRQSLSMTQAALASAAGVDRSHLRRFKSGRVLAPLSLLLRCASALGIDKIVLRTSKPRRRSRSSGDNSPIDGTHDTFFQMLPTPRIYARLPFYNLMNNTDEFAELMDKPVKQLALRADLHWLQLTSAHDLRYLGGGAYDNKVFGLTGRPANGATSLASLADVSADWQVTKNAALNFYYAYAQRKTVVAAICPTDRNMQYGYVELVYRWSLNQKGSVDK